MTNTASVIMTTATDREEAKRLAEILIETRAAACVQELGIHSHYRWEGKVNSDPEVLLLVKTTADRIEFAIDTIKKNHSYKIPEIIVIPVSGGLPSYLEWMNHETRFDDA